MEQQLIKQSKKRPSKIFIFLIILLLIVALFGCTGLILAGYIPLPSIFYKLVNRSGSSDFPSCSNGVFCKPIIYLYPPCKQQVSVKINFQGIITVSDPEYKNGWKVIVYPNGKILNLADNKEYGSLFWEGKNNNTDYDLSSGFVVNGSETGKFLKKKLIEFGLTSKEYNEFLAFWVPKMQNNRYNLIHFASQEEYSDKVPLDIIPKSDSLLRVFMAFKKLDKNIVVKPQEIKPFERNGFVVVEWGGTEIK